MNRIIRYFPDTNLKCGHVGLAMIAGEHDINVDTLNEGEFIIFVNVAQTALKLYTSGNLVSHLKMPDGARLNLEVIRLIPKHFNGTSIKYDAALKESLERKFNK